MQTHILVGIEGIPNIADNCVSDDLSIFVVHGSYVFQ